MPYQIKIEGHSRKMNINNLANYLCQTLLKLRDRNNQYQAVELLGNSSAIPTCILIAEIITKNTPGLSQITYFQQQDNKHDYESCSTGIKIRLTYNPTEVELQQPGFQQKEVDNRLQNNWDDLYKFVMMYSNNLSMFKKQSEKREISNKSQINQVQSQFQQQLTNSFIIQNNEDPRTFVYTCKLGIDNVNRSKMKTRGNQRK
ncbi:unnamed protein product [Paramecium sonneborni]|uniref:Uncharacterized protein n=1 Tax=Paramecium sonneborni TaxID=65129 RepID=A0A8S1R404_9CILI|nr:unnamed protein product [Paramecium sonneborni]